jgi:hypothetical protein
VQQGIFAAWFIARMDKPKESAQHLTFNIWNERGLLIIFGAADGKHFGVVVKNCEPSPPLMY